MATSGRGFGFGCERFPSSYYIKAGSGEADAADDADAAEKYAKKAFYHGCTLITTDGKDRTWFRPMLAPRGCEGWA